MTSVHEASGKRGRADATSALLPALRGRWKLLHGGPSNWPIPIGRARELGTPIWVWGNRRLAQRIVNLLNRDEDV